MEKCTFVSAAKYRSYVENLNVPWRALMRKGVREYLPARADSPLDLAPGADELVFLASGHVRLYSDSSGAEKTLTLLVGANCLLNMTALLKSPAALACSVTAISPITIYRLKLGGRSRAELISRYPELFINAVQSAAAVNLIFLYRSHALAFSSSCSRQCGLLLDLYTGGHDDLNLSQKDISELIGADQATVSRLLGVLARQGITAKKAWGRTVVLDKDKLAGMIQTRKSLQPWGRSHAVDA